MEYLLIRDNGCEIFFESFWAETKEAAIQRVWNDFDHLHPRDRKRYDYYLTTPEKEDDYFFFIENEGGR